MPSNDINGASPTKQNAEEVEQTAGGLPVERKRKRKKRSGWDLTDPTADDKTAENGNGSSTTESAVPTAIVPSSVPPAAIPSSAPPTIIPSSIPPSTIPSSAPPSTIPSPVPPSTIPSSSPPTTIPSSTSLSSIPSSAPPTSIPSSAPPTSIPSSAPPASVPSSAPPTSIPSSAPPTAIPSSAPPTSIPSSAPPTTIPYTAPSVFAVPAAVAYSGINMLPPTPLSEEHQEILRKAREYADTLRKTPLQSLAQNAVNITEMQKKQERLRAIQLMCRIYVGSINFDLGEEEISSAFLRYGPVRNVDLQVDVVTKKHKGFCFLEFETPEAAILALSNMGECQLGGRPLKVGRPTNAPQARPLIEEIQQEALKHASIYIACINPELEEEDIESVFSSFGKVKSCFLGYDLGNVKHKEFGYIEYEDMTSCQEAVMNMNNFDLGGRLIRVCRAITPPMPELLGTARGNKKLAESATPADVAEVNKEKEKEKVEAELLEKQKMESTLQHEDNVHISNMQEQIVLMQKLARGMDKKRVIVLKNMVDVANVDEYLEEEVTEECEKFGKTEKVVIHVGKNSSGEPAVKIYVKFAEPEMAERAQSSLNERWFDGRSLTAQFYDEQKFDNKDFS